jgi:hypothetical protein
MKAAKQPDNGFLGFPACGFRGICQGLSRCNSQQGNCSLMAVQAFAGSMADASEFAAFCVCERTEKLRNGMGYTANA